MANRASSGTRTTGTTPPAGPRDCFRRRGQDVGAQDRRRALQVARAEGLACRRAADALRRDMEDERGRLDAAVCEYERRKAALVGRQADAHERLSRVLRDRSAAELAAEAVRERAENELKARRTAGTVRAYRLNARWRQLHGRYRGFVVDVLRPQSGGCGGGVGGGGRGGGSGGGDGDDGDSDGGSDGGRAASRPANAPPPAAKTGTNRRFFAVADRVGMQNRRESLRTSRSLHALMVGYLRETTSAGGGDKAATVARPSRQRGRSIAVLDGAGPERVLDKLRAVQEQGARIAERVRRRAGPSLAGGVPSAADDKRRRSDVLCVARDRVSAGREYVDRVRGYADEAAAALDARPEQLELRGRLLRACEACEPRDARPRGSSSGGTAVEIAARLERACFELFGRLDRVGADARRRHAQSGTRSELGDVVAVCLRTVQKQRADAARQARDVARRVNDFRKAVDRLLSAASPGRTVARHEARIAATGRPPLPARTPIRRTDDKTRPIAAPRKVSTAESVAVSANVTLLCPPSIRIVGYEQGCVQK